MLIFNYPSKKALKASIGEKLNYTGSLFHTVYTSCGTFTGKNIKGRKFTATVTVRNDIITEVS